MSPEALRTQVKCCVMSFIPQASMDSLNPVKRIRDFILDVMRERTGEKPERKEILKMAGDHFETLGLDRETIDRYPHELSGGMKQRVVIGISTLCHPRLLMIDEPTSALDVTTQRLVIKSLAGLKRTGIIESMLFISHDITVLGQLCDRCAVMYGGKIVEVGTMDRILTDALHPYTRALISSVVSYDPTRMGKGGLRSIPGGPPDLRNPPPGCRFYARCEKRTGACKAQEPKLRAVKDGGEVACWLNDR
jgi:peptide/nickel transport system ATP-binding protein